MRYGFNLPSRGPVARPEQLIAIARRGEELGYDFLAVTDHIILPRAISSPYPYTVGGNFPSAATGEYLELITLLSFLAGVTRRIHLVLSVMVVPHRSPILTAKMLATLDVLSGGRVVLGAGVGWMEEEFQTLGLPPFKERGAVTDEYLRAFKELWTSENPTFDGKYCRFSNITFLPKPVQKPHIPIWIGGHSRRAIRRAAELGDGWHPIVGNPADPVEPEELRAELELLARYARKAGKDPKEIQVVLKASIYDVGREAVPGRRRRFTGSPEEITSDILAYERAGMSCLFFDVRGSRTAETMERLEWLAREVMTRTKGDLTNRDTKSIRGQGPDAKPVC